MAEVLSDPIAILRIKLEQADAATTLTGRRLALEALAEAISLAQYLSADNARLRAMEKSDSFYSEAYQRNSGGFRSIM